MFLFPDEPHSQHCVLTWHFLFPLFFFPLQISTKANLVLTWHFSFHLLFFFPFRSVQRQILFPLQISTKADLSIACHLGCGLSRFCFYCILFRSIPRQRLVSPVSLGAGFQRGWVRPLILLVSRRFFFLLIIDIFFIRLLVSRGCCVVCELICVQSLVQLTTTT